VPEMLQSQIVCLGAHDTIVSRKRIENK
jgi:hypothetical protein